MEADYLLELVKFAMVGFFSGLGSSAGNYFTNKVFIGRMERLLAEIEKRNRNGKQYPDIEKEVLNLKK